MNDATPDERQDGLNVEVRAHEICNFIELHSGKSISLNERAFCDLCHKLYDIWEHGAQSA